MLFDNTDEVESSALGIYNTIFRAIIIIHMNVVLIIRITTQRTIAMPVSSASFSRIFIVERFVCVRIYALAMNGSRSSHNSFTHYFIFWFFLFADLFTFAPSSRRNSFHRVWIFACIYCAYMWIWIYYQKMR